MMLKETAANGIRMIGNLRTGSYGRKITFIHPKSLNGVLTEFCEATPNNEEGDGSGVLNHSN